ncbi:Hypothetical protein, putative [Bodo saltans]|uniref:GPI-anchored surface protein n=1 Tax=Bodo saltans TaxID=75058 RepID=A0A0S4J7Q4_BODSA|nr:Hypothetical protein, putative [Bodo saltans]|eukprot:CUG80573.1 Hypothetical protein, putative [Bodo saltans]
MFRWELLFVLLVVVMHITCNGQLSVSAAELITQDIQCDNASSSSTPLTLNATNATNRHFRLLNCTRRTKVSVLCGIDADHPLTIEVVGGTTLPLFTLDGCRGVGGVSTFSDVVLAVSSVVMTLLPGNQLIGASTSFGMENVLTPLLFYSEASNLYRVSIIVEHSQLQWISTRSSSSQLEDSVLIGFITDDVANVSALIRNTSMFLWSNASLASLVAVISLLGGNLSLVMWEQSKLHVVHRPVAFVDTDSVLVRFNCASSCVFFNVAVLNSIVMLDSTGIAVVFVEFYSSVWATVVDSNVTMEDTNFTLQAQILCYVTSASNAILRRAYVSVLRSNVTGVLDMSNVSTLSFTKKNPSLFFARTTTAIADELVIRVTSVILTAMRNLSHNAQALLS